jgi:uncharacterized protein (TIGR03067 family)
MRGGKGAPEAILSAKFVVEKDKFIITITVNGMERKSPIQVKLHEKKTPKQIDFIKDGKVNSHGIYELKGKKLTLCFDRARRDRPKTFESKEGTQVQLLVLERREKK